MTGYYGNNRKSKLFLVLLCVNVTLLPSASIGDSREPYGVLDRHFVNKKLYKEIKSHDENDLVELTTHISTSDGPDLEKKNELWAYGDATGRVRAWVNGRGSETDKFKNYISSTHDTGTSSIPIQSSPFYRSQMSWYKTFTKGSVDAKVTATILPSFVELGQTFKNTQPGEVWTDSNAYISISICVLYSVADVFEPSTCTEKFDFDLFQEILLKTIHGNGLIGLGNMTFGSGGYPISPSAAGYVSNAVIQGFVGNLLPTVANIAEAPYRVDLLRYLHQLDLSFIEEGEKYVVMYQLDAKGNTYVDGGSMTASIADPLNVSDPDGGGIKLETTDQPYIGKLPRICSEAFDEQRYTNNQEGSITDRYTGLMWQRCPVNYTLDDKGTSTDLTDDSCTLDSAAAATNNWQSALQSAQASTAGGQSDWRIPNVKELETLVMSCLGAQIEPDIFPSTPINSSFWTNTSDQQGTGGNAWLVDFNSGDIRSVDTGNAHYARLLRNSGLAPVVPLPQMYASDQTVVEGDAGTTQLLFNVTMSKLADTEVTVDYVVDSPNSQAIVGVDFETSSGTLTFSPGELSKEVAVIVHGDLLTEKNERVYLKLNNASPNSRIVKPTARGRIIDDDTVSLGASRIALQLEEGDTGLPQTLDIPILLSQPLKSGAVSVDYTLRSDSAIAGTDFVLTSGTLNFNVGEQEKFITIESMGNNTWQNDRNFYIDLTNALGATFNDGFDNAEVYVRLVDDDGVAHGTGLNDTGPPECESGGLSCPALAGQDKDTGRDATANDDTDGIDGFAFTKLDNNGVPLTDQQAVYGNTPWDCVEDQVTGLIWEVKLPMFGGVPDIRKGGQTFSWYNSSGVNTNGAVGSENGGICNGNTDCDTEKYIAHINAIGLCGFSDWRLPNVDELTNIVYDGGSFFGPTLDTGYFPNQEIGDSRYVRATWTASPVITGADSVYRHNSLGIQLTPLSASVPRFYVRLVRGNHQR